MPAMQPSSGKIAARDFRGTRMELVWWHWRVLGLGLGLIVLEMLAPAFFLIWFGLGALITGLAAAVLPLGFTAQWVIWSLSSTVMAGIWMQPFRNPDRTRAGQAKEGARGMVGLVTRPLGEVSQGEIPFQRPVLGAERWPVATDQPIPSRENARVVDVLGQTLKIAKF